MWAEQGFQHFLDWPDKERLPTRLSFLLYEVSFAK